jgi:hypothetical protein
VNVNEAAGLYGMRGRSTRLSGVRRLTLGVDQGEQIRDGIKVESQLLGV